MPEPISLLTAAKTVGEIAGLPWAHVLPFYRALQEQTGEGQVAWLPKSAGRTIWMAHPDFIVPLLIALATAETPARSNEAVDWVYRLTLDGHTMNLDELPAAGIPAPVAREFTRYLADPVEARALRSVRFERSDMRVTFVPDTGQPRIFRFHVTLRKHPQAVRPPHAGITRDGRIEGHVLARIAERVGWQERGRPDFVTASRT